MAKWKVTVHLVIFAGAVAVCPDWGQVLVLLLWSFGLYCCCKNFRSIDHIYSELWPNEQLRCCKNFRSIDQIYSELWQVYVLTCCCKNFRSIDQIYSELWPNEKLLFIWSFLQVLLQCVRIGAKFWSSCFGLLGDCSFGHSAESVAGYPDWG